MQTDSITAQRRDDVMMDCQWQPNHQYLARRGQGDQEWRQVVQNEVLQAVHEEHVLGIVIVLGL